MAPRVVVRGPRRPVAGSVRHEEKVRDAWELAEGRGRERRGSAAPGRCRLGGAPLSPRRSEPDGRLPDGRRPRERGAERKSGVGGFVRAPRAHGAPGEAPASGAPPSPVLAAPRCRGSAGGGPQRVLSRAPSGPRCSVLPKAAQGVCVCAFVGPRIWAALPALLLGLAREPGVLAHAGAPWEGFFSGRVNHGAALGKDCPS